MLIRRQFTTALVAAGLALLPVVAHAQTEKTTIYKWTDAQGVVHYEMRKPADAAQTVETIQKRAQTPDSPAAAPATANAAANAAAKAGGDAKTAETRQKNPEICQRAQSNLEQLLNRRHVVTQDEYGNERILDEQEVQAQIKRAQEAVAANCE